MGGGGFRFRVGVRMSRSSCGFFECRGLPFFC